MEKEDSKPELNPYVLTDSEGIEPPSTWFDRLKYLGPGFILSAAIVGSGELIATTTLGAKAGFVTLWLILLSCLVKVTAQMQFGMHAIDTGESSIASFRKLPGPKFGNASWVIWSWIFLMIFKCLQLGGIVEGVALVLNIAWPGIAVAVWVWITATAVALLVFRGHYIFIERVSMIMISAFVFFTFLSLWNVQFTPYAFSWTNVLDGLELKLPIEAIGIAIAAFGITGVGANEIVQYSYWCLEKGYARNVGRHTDDRWARRAKGWIKVMYLDAILAMVIYTIATVAFYLLGAAVLHGRGAIPEGYDMVKTLSTMYTETLGSSAKEIFLLGAGMVLFSTLFAALAAWTRTFSDAFGQIGLIDFYDSKARRRTIAMLAWLFAVIWSLLFILIKLPVIMILIGGIADAVMMVLVVFVAIHYRYQRLSVALRPGKIYDGALWISCIAIILVGVYGITKLF